jgi:hypothetical protein
VDVLYGELRFSFPVKIKHLKNSIIMERGDKLETAYIGQSMRNKYPFCGLSIEELNV